MANLWRKELRSLSSLKISLLSIPRAITCCKRPGASSLGWRGILFIRQDLLAFQDVVVLFPLWTKGKKQSGRGQNGFMGYGLPGPVEKLQPSLSRLL